MEKRVSYLRTLAATVLSLALISCGKGGEDRDPAADGAAQVTPEATLPASAVMPDPTPQEFYDLLDTQFDTLTFVDGTGREYTGRDRETLLMELQNESVTCVPFEGLAAARRCTLSISEPEEQLDDGSYTGFAAFYRADFTRNTEGERVFASPQVVFLFAG